MPATSTRQKTPDRHQDLPRGSATWRGRKSSPRSGPPHSPSQLRISQWIQRVGVQLPNTVAGPPRHQTGFRGFRPRSIVMAKLSTSQRLRKRDNHRRADDQSYCQQITRIDRAGRWRSRKIDHCNRVFRHVAGEESSVVPLIDSNWIDFAYVWTADLSGFVFDHYLV